MPRRNVATWALPFAVLGLASVAAGQFADTNFPLGPRGLVNETAKVLPLPSSDTTTITWRGLKITLPVQAPQDPAAGACTTANIIPGCADPSYVWNCNQPKSVGLVFDDGPNYWTRDILAALKAYNDSKATFCMVGRMLQLHPIGVTLLKEVIAAGHDICIHTLNHLHLSSLSNEEIAEEIMGGIQVFRDILGPTFVPRFLRPPFGDLDDRVKAVAEALGLKILLWNLDSKDFVLQTNTSATDATYLAPYVQYLEPANSIGYITLSHDIVNKTRLLLPTVLDIIRNASYQIVLPSACSGMGSWALPQDIAGWVDYDAPTATPVGPAWQVAPTPFHYMDPTFAAPTHQPAPVANPAPASGTSSSGATSSGSPPAAATASTTGPAGSTGGSKNAAVGSAGVSSVLMAGSAVLAAVLLM